MWAVSPSQINTLDECARKYAFKYVAKIETPEKPSAALGTATHHELEAYYRGEPLDFTKIVDGRKPAELLATCLHLFPPPGPNIRSEPEWKREFEGVTFAGRIDVWESVTESFAKIEDLKTTSDIYKWAKKDLSADPQAILYGWHAVESLTGPMPRVALQWNYTQTRGARKAEAFHGQADWADSQMRMQDLILPKAKRILTIIQEQPDPNDLEPNPEACNMYGGCPFKSVCSLSPFSRMFGPLTENQMPDAIDDFLKSFDTPKVPTAQNTDPLADLINAPEGRALGPVKVETAPAVQNPKAEVAPAASEGMKIPEQNFAKVKAGKTKKLIGELCLGCAPCGETVTYMSDLMPEVNAKIQADHGVQDWRLIQYTAGAMLASATEQVLRSRGHTKILVLDPRAREYADLAHTLEINADRVFR